MEPTTLQPINAPKLIAAALEMENLNNDINSKIIQLEVVIGRFIGDEPKGIPLPPSPIGPLTERLNEIIRTKKCCVIKIDGSTV